MKNIIKAQFFQIIRSKLIWGMFLVSLCMQGLMMILPIVLETEEINSAGEYFANSGASAIFFPVLFLAVITAEICGMDFSDKTYNYEIMGGHKRNEVYFGRVIPSLLLGGIGAFVLILLPVCICVVFYGWGAKISVAWMLLRWCLLWFPLLRIVCEFAFLTFLTKNQYIVMGVGYLVLMTFFSLMTEGMEVEAMILGVTNLVFLTQIEQWTTYGLDGGLNYVFDASLEMGAVFGTIVASIVMGVGALYLGYVFFKHDDMD